MRGWRSSTTRRSPGRRRCVRWWRRTGGGCGGRSRWAEDVVLCAGAGQAFVTIAEALGPVKLAVEDPGHEGIRGLFAKRGLRPVAVRVDEQGVVVDELPGRRAGGAAHARPPVPDGCGAERRAAGGAAALGGRARRADHRGRLRRRVPLRPRADRRAAGAAAGPRRARRVGVEDAGAGAAARLADRAARVARAAARGARVARPRPAGARAARARRLHHPRRVRPPPAALGPRVPAPPRRADRGAEPRAAGRDVHRRGGGPAHRGPHPRRRRARAGRGAAGAPGSSSTASRRTASRPARAAS